MMTEERKTMQTISSQDSKWPAGRIVYVLLLCAGYASVVFFFVFMFRTTFMQ
jgi:hypothetical protein